MNLISYQPVLPAPGAATAGAAAAAAAFSSSEAVTYSEDDVVESSSESVILACVVFSSCDVHVSVAHCQHKQNESLMQQ